MCPWLLDLILVYKKCTIANDLSVMKRELINHLKICLNTTYSQYSELLWVDIPCFACVTLLSVFYSYQNKTITNTTTPSTTTNLGKNNPYLKMLQ